MWQSAYLGSIVLCFWTSYTMMAAISGLSLHRSALQSVIHALLYFSPAADIGVITNLFSRDSTLIDNELPMAITNLALDVDKALELLDDSQKPTYVLAMVQRCLLFVLLCIVAFLSILLVVTPF